MILLEILLSVFRWYRRWKGGHWYKLYFPEWETGMAGSVFMWTRELPKPEEPFEIVAEEDYD